MINALVIIFVAAIFFALGVRVATVRSNRIFAETHAHNEAYLAGEVEDVLTAEYIYENGMFEKQMRYPCPREDCGAPEGELCNPGPGGGVWVHIERFHYADEIEARGYDYVIAHNATPGDEGVWVEIGIQNACGHGCKIYQHRHTGVKILWHNSAYGCRQ